MSDIQRHIVKGVEGFVAVDPVIRFWDKVEKGDGCWLWTGAKHGGGYGAFWDGVRMVTAHRFAYELCVGPIPDGLYALHHCDVRPCVNPEHLFLGTNRENLRDMVNKGRQLRGERNVQSKLTEDDVREMRIANAGGESLASLGRRYGVSYTTIQKAVQRRSWGHVA